jgi:hypothetical protein
MQALRGYGLNQLRPIAHATGARLERCLGYLHGQPLVPSSCWSIDVDGNGQIVEARAHGNVRAAQDRHTCVRSTLVGTRVAPPDGGHGAFWFCAHTRDW